MRILMLAPTPFFSDRGCHVRIFEEARALQDLGHQVLVCTYAHGTDPPGIRTVRAPGVTWYRKCEPGPSLHKLYMDPLLAARAATAASRFRPHVVHAHLHEGAVLGVVLRRLFRVPLVLDYQGSFTEELADHGALKRGTPWHRLLVNAERRLYRYVDAVLCNTSNAVESLNSFIDRADERVHVIPDGADPEFFRRCDGPEVAELRGQLGLRSDEKVLVYLGTLNHLEGIHVLLSAAKILLAARPDVRFLVMGYPNADEYRERARRMGLGDRLLLTGRIPYRRAPAYLSLGDVAVSPKLSTTEGNGKLFAYMGVGLPTVCFDLPVNREILGDHGVYAVPGDAAALAAALGGVLDSPLAAEKSGGLLRRRLEEQFSYAAIGRRLVAVYEAVASGRPYAV